MCIDEIEMQASTSQFDEICLKMNSAGFFVSSLFLILFKFSFL